MEDNTMQETEAEYLRDRFSKLRAAALELFQDVEQCYADAVKAKRVEVEAAYSVLLAEYDALSKEFPRRRPPTKPPQEPHRYVDPKIFFSSHLTEAQTKKSQQLRLELKDILGRIAIWLRGCPMLSEVDARDLSFYGKTLVAAVQFKEFNYWESKPITDDSGNVIFVEPAGQEETFGPYVRDIRSAFSHAAQKVLELMEYRSSQDAFGPQEPRTTSVNAVPSYRPNTAFIMMRIAPEDPNDEDLLERIEEVFNSFGIKASRVDRIAHEGRITDRIIQEILTSEFLFADLTGERPSVYYEVGFAHASNKRVILFRQKGCKIHFDLANYNCPEYKNLTDLEKQLTDRLTAQGLVRTINKDLETHSHM